MALHGPKHHHQSKSSRPRRKRDHPRALINFTIPSLHDDTVLDCRIYHPPHQIRHAVPSLSPTPRPSIAGSPGKSRLEADASASPLHTPSGARRVKAAVLAHPYGPLGGSQDDPVVMLLTEQLLQHGWVVATFNFRGAGGSAGRTSWSAKPEMGDMASVIGLLVRYTCMLADGRSDAGPGPGRDDGLHVDLLLGGYSYGSMVVGMLPDVDRTMRSFDEAEEGSAAAEIWLRGTHLADETLKRERERAEEYGSGSEDDVQHPVGRGRHLLKPSDATRSGGGTMVFGGEETAPDVRRRSQDHHHREHHGRISLDAARKSMESVPQRMKHALRTGSHGKDMKLDASRQSAEEAIEEVGKKEKATGEEKPKPFNISTRYLLISPLLPPLSGLLGMSASSVFPHRLRNFFSGVKNGQHEEGTGLGVQTLTKHPALAIFGSEDGFTSSRRLTAWAEKMHKMQSPTKDVAGAPPGHSFEWKVVEGAGHFWREDGVADVLCDRLASWLDGGDA